MLQVWRAAALVAITALGIIGRSPVALSQSNPAKPVRMLVGFAPGGSTDTIARLITPRLSERLGQQVIIENRPGAAGNIAAEQAAKVAPDGYTVFMASASHTINASLYPKLSFDAIKDFTAITLVTSSPFVLVIHPSVPARNARELIALAKSRPGELNYGSGGATSHLAGELFNSMAGVKLVHIPYKSSGPPATDLLGGQLAIMFSAPMSPGGQKSCVRPERARIDFVDSLVCKTACTKMEAKSNENFVSSLLVGPLEANKGRYPGFHSKSAGGFAVSSLSDT